MATYPNRRLRSDVIDANQNALRALLDLADYTPINPAFSSRALVALNEAMDAARQAEARAERTLAAARDAAQEAEWAMHEAMLGAKAQVIAQYGHDSNAITGLGLKKKSDRKRLSRRVPAMIEE